MKRLFLTLLIKKERIKCEIKERLEIDGQFDLLKNVEPKNPKALADAIRFICKNPEIYIKMSKKCFKKI